MLKRPSSTRQNRALPASQEKACGVGSSHPCLSAQAQDFLEQRGAALGVEMRRHLVEQQDRRALAAARQRARRGRGRGRSAAPSARPSSTAALACAFGACATSEIGAVRAIERAPRRAVALAARRAAAGRSYPRPRPPACASRSASSAPSSARRRRGKRRSWIARRALGHDRRECRRRLRRAPPRWRRPSPPSAIRGPRSAQSSRTPSASSRLRCCMARSKRAGAGAIAGVETQDQPVEKAAPLGARPGEQAVHGRRHPHDLDVVGERAGTGRRLAVDAHERGRARSRRSSEAMQPSADVDRPHVRVRVRGHRPAAVAVPRARSG